MTFTYYKGAKGLSYSNIMFPKAYPMRQGKFPKDHPCYGDPKPFVSSKYTKIDHKTGTKESFPGEQPESDTNIGRFRARGYWASCFPEGDGITFEPLNEQSDETILIDIAQCFGVDVIRAK